MLKRSTEYYQSLLREFTKLPTEVEWIEFKVNNKDPERIAKLIKPVDPDTAPRYMRYIPFWA